MLVWTLVLEVFSGWAADGLLNCKGKNSVISLNILINFEKYKVTSVKIGVLLILVTLEKLDVCQ